MKELSKLSEIISVIERPPFEGMVGRPATGSLCVPAVASICMHADLELAVKRPTWIRRTVVWALPGALLPSLAAVFYPPRRTLVDVFGMAMYCEVLA